MKEANLTRRESEIAELIAWGGSKKEIAQRLFISERTVENHTRNIYEKTGCSKVNELSAWWFCTRFHISFDLSPIKRNIIAAMLIVLMIPQMFDFSTQAIRTRNNATRTVRVRTRTRKNESDDTLKIE